MDNFVKICDPFVMLIIKILSGVVITVIGTTHYSWIASKKELDAIAAKTETETQAQANFQNLIQDGLAYAYQHVIKKGQADGKDLSTDAAFEREAQDAAINFIRNTADRYGMTEYVSKLNDAQMVSFLKWALGKTRFLAAEAQALAAAKLATVPTVAAAPAQK